MDDLRQKKKKSYTPVIIGLCFLMVFITLGFCSSPKKLFTDVVPEMIGVKRSVYSISDSCRYVATSVVNIFFGTLLGRYGPRKLISAGFAVLICSSLLYATATNVFMLYLGGCLLGIGLSWTTTTMVGSVVNRWCHEKKGTVMGAILAANGLGGAVAIWILSPMIVPHSNSYRNAYFVVAMILLAVGVLMAGLFRDNPENTAVPSHNVEKHKNKKDSHEGLEFSKAKKQPFFYLIVLCIFFSGFILQGFTGIDKAHIASVGINPEFITVVLGFGSISLAVFKFLTGVIYDAFGLRVTTLTCCTTAVIVMLLLALVNNSVTGMVFTVIYAIFSSLALPLETIMLPIYARELFGERSFNQVLGIFVSVNTAGYALGAPFFNLCYDLFDSYTPSLFVGCGIMVFVTVSVQIVITLAGKAKKESEREKERELQKEQELQKSDA